MFTAKPVLERPLSNRESGVAQAIPKSSSTSCVKSVNGSAKASSEGAVSLLINKLSAFTVSAAVVANNIIDMIYIIFLMENSLLMKYLYRAKHKRMDLYNI
ncbi:MAG TPA: hypothetical protein DCY00_01405 [Actinobacteria bacterium]|nr:hypothetical protein [Actinomycetota bacterium]